MQEDILRELANQENCTTAQLAKTLQKAASQISHALKHLEEQRLLKRIKKGKTVYVYPVFDVVIAYRNST